MRKYTRRLPHWRSEHAVYLVGWRLSTYQQPLSEAERAIVADAIRFFDGQRFALYAFVVMDDHVHAIVRPSQTVELERIVHSWKSFTASTLVKDSGRRAPIWQPEYYDHIVRDQHELEVKVAYVLDNPFRRWTGIEEYLWRGTGTGDNGPDEINRSECS